MAGLPAHQTALDLLNKKDVRNWIAAGETIAGRSADVLIYVAGGVLGQSAKPLEEVDEEAWRAVLDVNLTGAFLSAQAVAPGMKQRGKGRIVFIASGAGLRTSLTGIQAYASAKASRSTRSRRASSAPAPTMNDSGSPTLRTANRA